MARKAGRAEPARYDHAEVEPRWQRFWSEQATFRAVRRPGREKRYVLDMFPYPSAAGLHVGHPEGYTATDIVCRYFRMRGYDVLHPMGWDAFGLPAEQHAIRTGTHQAATTRENIATFKRQMEMLGLSYDWTREIDTTRGAEPTHEPYLDTRLDGRNQSGQYTATTLALPARSPSTLERPRSGRDGARAGPIRTKGGLTDDTTYRDW